MLVIREKQMLALGAVPLAALKQRMQAQLRQHWAPLCEQLGQERLEDFVDHAIGRCQVHGIEQANDHLRYLNAMALLGADFDEDIDWAQAHLANHAVRASSRMDDLCAAIARHVNS